MNYENEIYKINDNLYMINWFNFLKIKHDIELCKETNFITNYKRGHFQYIDWENIDKYNYEDLIYDKEIEKMKIYTENKKNNFPYLLLNIDYSNELLYKNENNEWFLLKYSSYDTNKSVRCQQGVYKEYKIELSNDNTHDLVIKRNLLEPDKYKDFFFNNYKVANIKNTCEKVELYKDYNDSILNILFSNKFPLYFYPNPDDIIKNKIVDICIKIKMIKLKGNSKKVILKYKNKEYYYAYINFYLCCGSGSDSFIQLNSKEDMEYFDYQTFKKDEKMQKHFEYLKTIKNNS